MSPAERPGLAGDAGFVPLGCALGPEQVGHKFWNLSRLARRLSVPPALCVTIGVFQEALGPGRRALLERFFEDQRATVGCFLLSSMPRLNEALSGLELTGPQRSALRESMEAVFGRLGGRFAVRSSAAHEDAPQRSFAGVYRSRLDLGGFDAVCAAIADCWRAYYSFPAIAARLRSDDFAPQPALALIVQEMVPAVLAGVAFTRDPAGEEGPVVEYVRGTGEALVSGAAAAQSYRPGRAGAGPGGPEGREAAGPGGPEGAVLRRVLRAAALARRLVGHEADLEWAWDGRKLHVLQVRPITAGAGDGARAGVRGGAGRGAGVPAQPRLEVGELYLDAGLPSRMDLRECRDVYAVYVPKRARAYRLAAAMGVSTGAARVLEFNVRGLESRRGGLEEALGATPAPEVVVDVSNSIRQIIVPKGSLVAFLQETFALDPTGWELHTVIVRDYVRGQYGFISRLTEPGGLLVELSPEGLLGINRGIADCRRALIPDPDRPARGPNLVSDADQKALEELGPAFAKIASFTRALNRDLPGTQLEWVLESGEPFFVDYSRATDALALAQRTGSLVISPGVARGPALVVSDDEVLRRLSIGPAVSVNKYDDALEHADLGSLIQAAAALPQKPVLFVSRPYAILSALFEHVAGFVFEQGSLLCHLAILLREARLPAVVCPGAAPAPGAEALIEEGRLTLF